MGKIKKLIKFVIWIINPFSGASFIDRIYPPGGKRRLEYDKKQTEKKYQEKVNNYFKLSDSNTAEYWKGIDHRLYLKYEKTLEKENLTDYEKWMRNNTFSDQEIELQRKKKFKIKPKISIVCPLYNTDTEFFRELLYSIHCQTYSNWELCLADGSENEQVEIKEMIKNDKRIKYYFIGENKGISGNTNEAIKMATGDYIAFVDHDDMLDISALYEIVKAINEDKNIEFIYSDEDKFHFLDEPFFDPFFKPDFCIDTLISNNYICHLSVYKKKLLNKIGLLNDKYNGSQDFDMTLRMSEKTNKIKHVEKVLYHWRVHNSSTSKSLEVKPYIYEAGQNAIKDHFERLNIKGEVNCDKKFGTYHATYLINGNPEVDVLLLNANKDQLITSIDKIKITSYNNYKIYAVCDSSFMEDIKTIDSKINIIESNNTNIPIQINSTIKKMTGEYVAIFDGCIENICADWIEESIGLLQRSDIGLVGAKIIDKNQKIINSGYMYNSRGIVDLFQN